MNLLWCDVNLQRRLIVVQSGESFRTKGGRLRTIPMNDVVFTMLSAKHMRSTSEYVFTLNGRPVYGDWISHKLKSYIRNLEIDERLHFHSLRHTFASWLVQDGVSLYEVQKLLGHSNIAVTQMYSHLQPEHLHDTVNKITVTLN